MQLPISLALFAVCLPVLLAVTRPALGFAFPSWFSVDTSAGGPAWIGLAMAGPFALSGLMLRATSHWRLYWDEPVGGGLAARLLGLVATIVGIAVVSILLTIAAAFLILIAGSWALGAA
ncbi:hypothetical protein [Agromyces sp. SYSU T00266]|uniref:hypothetical protein n=1 Tax=Agromyces zhanjiangensis TaxID=3158562 RepID=UPI003392092C